MTSIDESLIAAPAQPRIGRLERRFYYALLSMAAVDLLLSGLFLALSGKLWVIALRLPEVTVFLVALNLTGGYLLFKPIRHFLATGEGRDQAIERASQLGSKTTVWVVIVSAIFTISSFVVTPFVVFQIPFTNEVMYILIGRALAWIVLLPYVAVFFLQEYMRSLRRALYRDHDILVPSGKSLLGRKLALVFVGGAVVPAASIAITLLLVPEISPITGQPRSVVIITTIVGAAIALLLAFWATQRSTTEGFRSLLQGMREIERGELGGRIVIETDDELDILLLEDEEALRILIAELLEEEAHAVTSSADGSITLDSDVLSRSSLMITDIIMPEIDGLEAIRRARAANPAIKIIAMSGGGRMVTRDYLPDAKAFGAAITLHKPFTPDEVIGKVRELLAA